MGTYMRTQKEISLLSNDQKGAIGNIGTAAQGSIQETFQQLAASSPELGALLQPLAAHPRHGEQTEWHRARAGRCVAHRYPQYVCRCHHSPQPIFMGGKIAAYNKITRYAEQLAQSQHATGMQDIILGIDQAYWQVISLVNKKKAGGKLSPTGTAIGQRYRQNDSRREWLPKPMVSA